MSVNKIDQFFKDKMENASPTDFDPQHWEAARQLLKEEKNNHKAWWIFSLSALVVLSLGLYLFSSLNKEVPNSQTAPRGEEMAELKLDKNLKITDLADPKPSADQSRIVGASTGHETLTKKMPLDGQPASQPSIVNERVSVAQKKELIYKESSPSEKNNQLREFLTMPSRASQSTVDAESLAKETESLELDQLEGLSKPKRSEKVATLQLIDKANFKLTYQYPLSAQYSAVKITREKFNRHRYAWSGTLLLNPANSSGSIIQGLLLGFTYEKYLRPHLFVGTKPSMQLQTNQNGFSKFEQITTYSFSAINTTYGLQADNLQFFSAPIYLAAESGKHTLELGVSLDLLLGARGKLQQISVEDQYVSAVENLGSGWIETTDMRKLSTNLFLGYKTSINPRLKTGISFFYNPGKLYPGLPNSLPQAANAKWYLGWQANYYVK